MWLGTRDVFDWAMDEVNQNGGYLNGSSVVRTAPGADIIHREVYLIVTSSSNRFITFCRAIKENLDITPGNVPSGQFHRVILAAAPPSFVKRASLSQMATSEICMKWSFFVMIRKKMRS